MLGLEGYGSEDSADSSDEHPEHPLVSTSAPQKTAKQGDALPSTSTLALPDAASLFSTTTDSRLALVFASVKPWIFQVLNVAAVASARS